MIKNNIPIEKAIQNISNENLLVNSDFRNPINTSGKSEFIVTNGTIKGELMDGWIYGGGEDNSSVYLRKGYIELKSANEFGFQIEQRISGESLQKLNGKCVTLSNKATNAVFKVNLHTASGVKSLKDTDKCCMTLDLPNVFEKDDVLAIAISVKDTTKSSQIEYIKLEVGDKATPMPLAKFEDEWNRLKVIKQERLLWSGSMAKGQSAVIGGLSNFKKFKAYINNTGIVVLDFIGTEGGGKRKFTGEFYNYSSNNEEILAFCSAFINDNTFTNVMSNYVSLKNVAVHYENPIIQIWGIY